MRCLPALASIRSDARAAAHHKRTMEEAISSTFQLCSSHRLPSNSAQPTHFAPLCQRVPNLQAARSAASTLVRVGSYIESPPYLGRGCINIKNENDDLCFKWCLKYHQTNKSHNDIRLSVLSKINDKYDYTGLTFPLKIDEIEIFERKNIHTSVNVFGCINNNVSKLYISKNNSCDIINLFMISSEETNHYCYIKNISTMTQNTSNKRKLLYCDKCNFHYDARFPHKCNNYNGKTNITFKDGDIEFTKYKNMLDVPFVLYYDFESFLTKNNDEKRVEKHEVNSYAYKIVCIFDKTLTFPLRKYLGPNAVAHFLDSILKDKDTIDKIIKDLRLKYKLHNLTVEEENTFLSKKQCEICNSTEQLVRDHSHLTGKYRQAICSSCNLKLTETKNDRVELVCIAHNSSGYDGHFIINEAQKYTHTLICELVCCMPSPVCLRL
jgi:hypothetical protein